MPEQTIPIPRNINYECQKNQDFIANQKQQIKQNFTLPLLSLSPTSTTRLHQTLDLRLYAGFHLSNPIAVVDFSFFGQSILFKWKPVFGAAAGCRNLSTKPFGIEPNKSWPVLSGNVQSMVWCKAFWLGIEYISSV